MKILNTFYLIIVLAFTPSLAAANSYSSINYIIQPITATKTPTIKVITRLKGNFLNKLILDLPNYWANAEYSKQIKNIKIHDEDLEFKINNIDDHQLSISIPKSTNEIKISYEIQQKTGDPSNVHESIIRKDLIHSPGHGLFTTPADINDTDEINFSIKWDVPKQWNTLSSYGTDRILQFATNTHKLRQAVYVSGNSRIYQIADNKNPVFLSLYGSFDIEDSTMISSLGKIIKGQRDFFNDHNFPYYAMSLIEGNNPHSMGGTALHNSFTAFLPKGMEPREYYILLAHEHLHNWIGGKIHNPTKEERLSYWWSEGLLSILLG
jgi:predicted metalloprotease with PDZ domain